MIATPSWITKLARTVVSQMRAMDVMSPMGCHHFFNEAHNQWEITLFASRTETVGGEHDGRFTFSRFGLDVLGLIKTFSTVDDCHWQALSLGDEDELGPHISIAGEFAGYPVWLRILAVAPDQFEAGRILDASTLRFENTW